MSLINNIDINNINYTKNEIRMAIENNDPIEEKLHIIAVISNPCLYAIRYILMKEFIKRMEQCENNIILYIVELAYNNQNFIITDKNNKNHLQLRTEHPLWHKENMINLGVKYLLPNNWKAMAWIDADIEFESNTWVKDALKILNGSKDIIQLFSHCVDMNKNGEAMNIFPSFGYQYIKKNPFNIGINSSMNYWHTGYAWACTRKAYEKMGGLYEIAILGSGDNIISLCVIGKGESSIYIKGSQAYTDSIILYQKNSNNLRLGYVPGVIRHHFHGLKKNRKYIERTSILEKYNYNPNFHIKKDEIGLLIPTVLCPKEFLQDIMKYFKERNDDEDFI